jgi:hypothetical protein
MKTILQSLIDEIYYPISEGLIENKLIKRELTGTAEFTKAVSESPAYKGCLADCLISLLQAINVSEADKSVGAYTDADKKRILDWANNLYGEIDEPVVTMGAPKVTIIS